MFLVWCLNHGFTMLDLFQNVADGFGPHERLGVLVMEPDELVDGRNQLRHTREDTAPNALARDLPNHHSTRFSHEALVGVKCR